MPNQSEREFAHISSAPALAAALRETDVVENIAPLEHEFEATSLVPMYQVENGNVADEAAHAAHMVGEIAERLRRLADAYEAWNTFDAPAYFDLSKRQSERLVHVRERVSTVYVFFFADLLLPSFRRAESFWAERFCPIYQAAYLNASANLFQEPHTSSSHAASNGLHGDDADWEIRFLSETQPQMIEHWEQLVTVIRSARRELMDDIGFLSTNGSQEERARWLHVWQATPAPGLVPALRPPLRTIPTLSLSFEFPLPTHRQSGRLQRLRLHRDRLHRERQRRRGGR